MFDYFRIKHASLAIEKRSLDHNTHLQSLADSLSSIEFDHHGSPANFVVIDTSSGLELIWNCGESRPLKFQLDYLKAARQLRSFPAPKQGAFNQALGKKTNRVIDATGGWGGDASLMCLQGYEVTILERLPIMAALMADAFGRLGQSSWARNNNVRIPKVLCGDANEILTNNEMIADCVYLDPMFPPKRKKSAATNKQMKLLQWLAGPDNDAQEVAKSATKHNPRLAVKRPSYADPLLLPVKAQFSSKLVHYDVYFNS